MKYRYSQIIHSLIFMITLSACTHSRLNSNSEGSSATLGVFLPNVTMDMEDIAIPDEELSQIIPHLAKAKHRDRRGSPNPRMTYILTIRQQGVTETFYFFEDFTACSFSLPTAKASAVEGIIEGLIKKENANK